MESTTWLVGTPLLPCDSEVRTRRMRRRPRVVHHRHSYSCYATQCTLHHSLIPHCKPEHRHLHVMSHSGACRQSHRRARSISQRFLLSHSSTHADGSPCLWYILTMTLRMHYSLRPTQVSVPGLTMVRGYQQSMVLQDVEPRSFSHLDTHPRVRSLFTFKVPRQEANTLV